MIKETMHQGCGGHAVKSAIPVVPGDSFTSRPSPVTIMYTHHLCALDSTFGKVAVASVIVTNT